MKIIAVDYGSSKIWTAFWDTQFWICFPWEILRSKSELIKYLNDQAPDVIVIWQPEVNEWEKSISLKNCLLLKKEIEAIFSKSLVLGLDERMTTKIAKQKLKDYWISEKKWKNIEDSLSALIILESYFIINDHN